MARGGEPVAAGRRDRYVRLDQGTSSEGRSGRPVETWTVLAYAWANKADGGGSERLRTEQIQAQFDTTFVIPYRADMDPELVDVPATRRVVFEGRAFDVVGARQIGYRKAIELLAMAGSRIDGGEA